jgi:hypothetical protein
MKEFIHNVWQFILPAILAFGAFISPIAGVLTAVGVFIAADTVFARYRVYVQAQKNKKSNNVSEEDKEKAKWRSRKFRSGIIPKVISYNCFVLSFFIMDKFVINEFISIFTQIQFAPTKILALILIFTEITSIDESFEQIKGKSLFAYLLDMIKSAKKINKQMSNINEHKTKKNPEDPEV